MRAGHCRLGHLIMLSGLQSCVNESGGTGVFRLPMAMCVLADRYRYRNRFLGASSSDTDSEPDTDTDTDTDTDANSLCT